MPAIQRGQIKKNKGGTYSFRYYDENGKRRQCGPFKTRSEAGKALDAKLERVRMGDLAPKEDPPTVQELVDEFLAQHVCEPTTRQTITSYAKQITKTFGHVRVDRLQVNEIAAWRKQLPEGSGWSVHKLFRQVLNYAMACGYVTENRARAVKNPEPQRKPKQPFANWNEVEAVAAAMGSPLPIIVAGTGLRSEEWLALEWRDIDLNAGLLSVRRVFVDGRVKDYGKTKGSLRTIPLSGRVVEALKRIPRRLDTRLVFPGDKGTHLCLSHWRRKTWYPALEKAKLAKRVPYSMRDTFASFSLAAGVPLLWLARIMGTSAEMIDKTYGHLLPDSPEHIRGLLDAYDSRNGQRSDTGT